MKTIVEALKDLYVALGGKEQDVANLVLNPDVIEQIAAVASDAVKPELPALTGNAGKVLKVDADADGVEWGEAGGGGGGLTLYGPYYATPTESGTINAGGIATIQLKSIKTLDDDDVGYPDTEAKCFVASASAIGCIGTFAAPSYEIDQWYDGALTIINTTQQSVTIPSDGSVYLAFCSTVEFPLAEEPEN